MSARLPNRSPAELLAELAEIATAANMTALSDGTVALSLTMPRDLFEDFLAITGDAHERWQQYLRSASLHAVEEDSARRKRRR